MMFAGVCYPRPIYPWNNTSDNRREVNRAYILCIDRARFVENYMINMGLAICYWLALFSTSLA